MRRGPSRSSDSAAPPGEAGLDKSGTEDFVREGFGEWVERTLAETLTAAPVLTFEERVERALAVWDEGLRSSEPDDISPGFRLRRMRAALRAAGVEE